MTKFERGDRVRRSNGGYKGMTVGDVDRVVGVTDTSLNLEAYGDGHDKRNFELADRGVDHLQVGDILIDDDGEEREVFAVLGKLVAIHDGCNDGYFDSEWKHTERLKSLGWTLKDQPAEAVELTLEDVAKLKGVPVDQIKIVEK